MVACLLVKGGVEPIVLVRVGNIDDIAGLGTHTNNPNANRQSDGRHSVNDFGPQHGFVDIGTVDQKQGRSVRPNEFPCFGHQRFEVVVVIFSVRRLLTAITFP